MINADDALLIQHYILAISSGIEICNDGIDNDCNGEVDSADSKCELDDNGDDAPLCEQLAVFDCDGNGVFSSGDLTHLQQ